MNKICVIIPAYNASKNIRKVIEEAKDHVLPVVVVDDGSTDNTTYISKTTKAKVIRFPKNRGKGKALATAFLFAIKNGYNLVITVDADGQHDAKNSIPILLDAYKRFKADMVIGSRAYAFNQMTFLRRFWNRLSAGAISKMAKRKIDDTQSGLRLITTELLQAIPVTTSRYEAELELLIKACKKGFNVITIPISINYIDGRNSSHYRPVVDTFRICMLYLRSLLWPKNIK
ncbi:MAG: glycosyltransferase family 2 protein [Deltaproteobacteria bacterium]|nr:glycosyltransferase family 2 protein [Deltaproteobacteria bacterium]